MNQQTNEKLALGYQTMISLEQLAAYLEGAATVAFDFETSPKAGYKDRKKAALDPHQAEITGISLAVPPNCLEMNNSEMAAIYIPLRHTIGANLDPAAVLAVLEKTVFENPDCLKIVHNLAFESKFLLAAKITLQPPVFDTMAGAQLILKDAAHFRRLGEVGLKQLTREWFGVELPSFADTVGSGHFCDLDPQAQKTAAYAGADAAYALKLWEFEQAWLGKNIPSHLQLAATMESPVALYTAMMESAGVLVDQPLLAASLGTANQGLTELRQQLEHSGQRFVKVGANAATNDFKAYLFNDLSLPVLKTTETGKPSVDNEALDALMDYARENAPEVLNYLALVGEYRRLSKLEKTYLVGLASKINPVTQAIHSHFFPLGAETGRFTSQNPNCQNLPAGTTHGITVRDLLIARPGKTLVALDYSQIELRIGAWLTRDKKMMAVYQNGGDIHAMTTAGVYGITPEEAGDKSHPLYKERRSVAKNINFGIFYGLYPKGLQRILKLKAGLSLSLEACEAMIFNIHLAYPGLAPWQRGVIRQAAYHEKMGTALGRQRCLSGINSPDENIRSHAQRGALNHPIQGTAADILKLAMVRLLPLLGTTPAITPLLTVHDELVFEIDNPVLDQSIASLKQIMEETPFPGFDLPLAVEVSVGSRYGSLTSYDAAESLGAAAA